MKFTIMSACACRPPEDPLSVVNKCIESLEKLVNLKTSADRALYVDSIERLQLAVCTEGEIICLKLSELDMFANFFFLLYFKLFLNYMHFLFQVICRNLRNFFLLNNLFDLKIYIYFFVLCLLYCGFLVFFSNVCMVYY